MCNSLRPTKVPLPTLSAKNNGDLRCGRNQRFIKTTLPVSAYYVSPEDYAKDPTLPPPPNFVGQFKCMRLCFGSDSHRLTPEYLQQGLGLMTPHYILASGRVCSARSWFGRILTRHFVYIALDFREWLGGEVKINAYCRDLAIRGGKRLAEILGTEEMDNTPNRELTLNMVRKYLTRLGVVRRAHDN